MTGKRRQRASIEALPAKKQKEDRRSAGDENGTSQKYRISLPKGGRVPSKTQKLEMSPTIEKFCGKFKKPEDSIHWIISNSKMTVDEFFKTKWQKSPFAMHADEESKDLAEIFSYNYLAELISSRGIELEPGLDFTTGKHTDKESQGERIHQCLTKENLDKALAQGDTVQIMEPHRFQPGLHALMSPLETYFGSLVFSSGYVSPPGGQLRGPHFIDEECFVIQTSGVSTWKIYKNKEVLSTSYSSDFKLDEVGEPILTETLRPGDILYMPRGTVNECVAGDNLSCYITIRTFQRIYWANYLSETLPQLIDSHERKSVELRRGLPLGFLPHARIDNNLYADYLLKLADSIRGDSDPVPVPEGMVSEFMSFRMPPFGLEIDTQTETAPTENSKIQLRHKGHFTYYKRSSQGYHADEGADEEGNEEPEKEIDIDEFELVLLCSVKNDISSHGIVELEPMTDDAFAIDTAYEPLIKKLLEADAPIAVSELKGINKDGKPLNALMLAQGLFNIGAIEVVE
ncbi:MYC-induced nuclear antigen-like [Tropilaelaps mercedesae]|uniref:Bifunctional lysine-specific demethylase and histidyl-hydroxylase n=1 Tax=Tropilaelaps mercedesae TaxID=418985 RepID=A0A1V9XZI0_9ACAR|nr:MYC-induced nuclear antigen-like [Tropilaelaps mercedesae]